MVAVNGTARTSGFLRDKSLAQWIALNRLSEVRLNVTKFGQNTDTGELNFGNRKWHYDTRYFDTSIASMKRVVVRVYLGDAKTKGNPVGSGGRLSGQRTGDAGFHFDCRLDGGHQFIANGQTAGDRNSIAPNNPTSPGNPKIRPSSTQNPGGTPVAPPPNPPGTAPVPTPPPTQ